VWGSALIEVGADGLRFTVGARDTVVVCLED
jgi:hypothetical protein